MTHNRIIFAIILVVASATTAHAAHNRSHVVTTTAPTRYGQPLPPTVREPWLEEEICRCPRGAAFDSPLCATPWLVERPDWHSEPCCIWRRKHWFGLRVAACAAIFCISADKQNS